MLSELDSGLRFRIVQLFRVKRIRNKGLEVLRIGLKFFLGEFQDLGLCASGLGLSPKDCLPDSCGYVGVSPGEPPRTVRNFEGGSLEKLPCKHSYFYFHFVGSGSRTFG